MTGLRRLAAVAVLMVVWCPVWALAQVGAPVVGLQGHANGGFVSLSWTGTDDDYGHAGEIEMLGGFTILGALAPGGPVIAAFPVPWITPGPEGSLFRPEIVLPAPDGTYWVAVVKGLTNASTGPPSAWVQVVVNVNNCGAVPGAPVFLQSLPVPGTPVALSWTPPEGGCAPTHFVVVAGSAPGLADLAIIEITGVVTILHGTAPAGTYYVRVHAKNNVGLSAPSNEVQVVVGGCAGPSAPVNLTATAIGNSVQLNWSPPLAGDLSYLYGYRLTARVVGNPTSGASVVTVGPGTSFLSPPIGAATYEIQVQAISICPGAQPQLSAPSVAATVTVP